MPLIKCGDCGKEISSEAENCPNCGKPSSIVKDKKIASISRFISSLLLVLVLLGFIWLLIWSYLPKQLLVGKWEQKRDTIEILSDNVINIKNGSTLVSGTYKILDSKTARVNLYGLGALLGPVTIDYTVTVDELTITYDNKTETYKRITNLPVIVKLTNSIPKEISDYINK